MNRLKRLYKKLSYSLREEGIAVTWYRAITSLRFKLFRYQDRKWVHKHQVATLEDVEIDEMGDIAGDHKSFGFTYVASPVCQVRTITRSLIEDLKGSELSLENFTFIDYGSGKGQAVMAAAEYPFNEVLGVEFSRRLHEQAESNLESFRRYNPGIVDMKSIPADASQVDLPVNPCLLYFFNPFSETVMRQVLKRIEKRLEISGEPVYIAYSQAKLEDPHHTTTNMEIIAGLDKAEPIPIKFNSVYDMFLLGSFKIALHKLS